MKIITCSLLAICAACIAIALTGCQGLTLGVDPSGNITGTYTPPPKAPVVHPEK